MIIFFQSFIFIFVKSVILLMFDEYTNKEILRSIFLHETMSFTLNRMSEKQRKRLCSYTVPLNIVEDLQEMLVLVCCDENGNYDEDDDFT